MKLVFTDTASVQCEHTHAQSLLKKQKPAHSFFLFFASVSGGMDEGREEGGKGDKRRQRGGIVFPPCLHYGWAVSMVFDQLLSDGLKVACWGYQSLCVCDFVSLSVCDYDRERERERGAIGSHLPTLSDQRSSWVWLVFCISWSTDRYRFYQQLKALSLLKVWSILIMWIIKPHISRCFVAAPIDWSRLENQWSMSQFWEDSSGSQWKLRVSKNPWKGRCRGWTTCWPINGRQWWQGGSTGGGIITSQNLNTSYS